MPIVKDWCIRMRAILGEPYSLKSTREDVTCTLAVYGGNDATGSTVLVQRVVNSEGDAIPLYAGLEDVAFGKTQYKRMLKTARAGAIIAGRKLATMWNDAAAQERYWDGQAEVMKHCEDEEKYAQATAHKQARSRA